MSRGIARPRWSGGGVRAGLGAGTHGRRTLVRWVGMVCALLAVMASVCAAQDSVRTTRLIGRVVDSLGAPLSGAIVSVMSENSPQATTDNAGQFNISAVPVGRVEVHVRRLGYTPITFTGLFKSGVVERVRLVLSVAPIVLDTVSVNDTVSHPWLQTFDRRRSSGRGYFFTREDIVRAQVQSTSDLLRRIPGVTVVSGRTGTQVLFTRTGMGGVPCVPQLYVHSMTDGGRVDDFVPDDIEAMEVYPGISTVPVELQSARAHSCGAIVIWTREPPPAGGGGGDVRR
ncbi:MAG TPA: TonB-dependent receptor [Gemmatimonadaceae bacterium]